MKGHIGTVVVLGISAVVSALTLSSAEPSFVLPAAMAGIFSLGGAKFYYRVRQRVGEREDELTQLRESNAFLRREIAAQAERFQELNRNAEHFTQAAAHDLRAPLRTASCMLDLFARRYQGRDASILNSARRNLTDLDQTLTELLTYHAVAGRGFLKEDGPVCLQSAVNAATANLLPLIQDSMCVLLVSPLPRVVGARVPLVLLFQNLIENAIKYRSPYRTPVVRIDCESSGGFTVVRIADNGVGFDPKEKDALFKPFVRLHAHVPGTGLGLATCARIVGRLGGLIWAESDFGGATFYVKLQLEKEHWLDDPASASVRCPYFQRS